VENTPELAIVLMDIMMPEMDGIRRWCHSGNPTIAPSDHRADRKAMKGDREKCLRPVPPLLGKGQSTPNNCCPRCALWLHR